LGRPESREAVSGELDQEKRVQINKERILHCLTKLNDKATFKAATLDLRVIVQVGARMQRPPPSDGSR